MNGEKELKLDEQFLIWAVRQKSDYAVFEVHKRGGKIVRVKAPDEYLLTRFVKDRGSMV